MIEMMDGKIDLKSLVKLYFIGFYYGSISPGRAGEFIKGYYLSKNGLKTEMGMLSILFERLYDIATPIAFLTVYYSVEVLLHKEASAILLFLGTYPISIVLWIGLISIFNIFKNKIRFLDGVEDIPLEALFKNVLMPAAASILNWACIGLSAYLLLVAFDVTISFSRVMFAVCIALLSILLPVTINGWGIREAAYVWALSPFSEPSVSIVFSITFVLIGTYSLAFVGLLYDLVTKHGKSHD